jgi:hypothetical protein
MSSIFGSARRAALAAFAATPPAAAPPGKAMWRSEVRFLWQRIRRARRPDLYLARLLGRPLPDRLYLQLGHLLYFGRWPDLEQPRTLNEHIIAYMLRCRDPLLQVAADKLRARRYIAEHAGARYLVPLLGSWQRAEEVAPELLPRPCVLKPTAASGKVIFLRRDEAIDPARLRAELQLWLDRDYSLLNREWAYRGVRQQIVAEQMLAGADGALPPDYKCWVIGGKVRLIHVDRGRFARHTRNLYLPDWRPAPARLTLDNHAPDARPRQLDEMIEVAQRLAEPFEFLRVDCYIVDGALYVGELTNSPGAGFERFIPASFAFELGAYWKRHSAGWQPSA